MTNKVPRSKENDYTREMAEAMGLDRVAGALPGSCPDADHGDLPAICRSSTADASRETLISLPARRRRARSCSSLP